MNKNITYIAPVLEKKASTRQDEKWDEAIAYFNNKQYEKVLPTLIDYVGSHLQDKQEGNTYTIAHGSVVVHITQTDKELLIKCPFLDISSAKRIPLSRKLIELRMTPLNLTNIIVESDLVYFQFSCPIHLCEPYKLYGVLREICYYADRYDDEFIEKFDAQHLQEPSITHFATKVKEEVYANSQNILQEGLARFDHYMEQRDGNNAWYILNITLKRLEFYAEPQGYLASLIEEGVNSMFNRQVAFHDRLLQGKKQLEKLQGYPKDKFINDLYQVETFIPHKYSGKKENIRDNWEESYSDAQDMIANGRYEDASILLQSCFYGLFYYNLVDEAISNPIIDALAQANGLDFTQAASILLTGMQAIMEDGMMGKDFGMDLSKIMGEQMQQSMAAMQQIMANFKMN